jgi:hypothetical protein
MSVRSGGSRLRRRGIADPERAEVSRQAQALKTWKISRGIPTSLVQVNDGALGGPDTNIEIDQ